MGCRRFRPAHALFQQNTNIDEEEGVCSIFIANFGMRRNFSGPGKFLRLKSRQCTTARANFVFFSPRGAICI